MPTGASGNTATSERDVKDWAYTLAGMQSANDEAEQSRRPAHLIVRSGQGPSGPGHSAPLLHGPAADVRQISKYQSSPLLRPGHGPCAQAVPASALIDSAPSVQANPSYSPSLDPCPAAGATAGRDVSVGQPKEEEEDDPLPAPSATVGDGGHERLKGVAAIASAAQPTGHTLETTNVHTEVPFLLKVWLHCLLRALGLPASAMCSTT